MDRRVEVRCTEEQLARWREAAGDVPLGRWIRGCCESRVDGCEPLVQELGGGVGGVPVVVSRDWGRFTNPRLTSGTHPDSSSFRPDFKGG
jgi:hypothetical protein